MVNDQGYLYISGIEAESVVDGPGIRYAVFTQGCMHHCPGCHNPETHPLPDKNTKKLSYLDVVFEFEKNLWLKGLTISGGDPICQSYGLYHFLKGFKERLPNKSVVVYTGYTFESLMNDSIHSQFFPYIDVLIDGKYIEQYKDLGLEFRGSRNQRYIRLKNGKVTGLGVGNHLSCSQYKDKELIIRSNELTHLHQYTDKIQRLLENIDTLEDNISYIKQEFRYEIDNYIIQYLFDKDDNTLYLSMEF